MVGRKPKLAEVVSEADGNVVLLAHGDSKSCTITRAEVTRWWNVFLPPDEPDDLEPPRWVRSGQTFILRKSTAIIRTVRGSWLSYVEWEDTDTREHVQIFRLLPYKDFLQAGWEAMRRPSIWEWLRHPAV
jgi:hypothetical protein